MLIRRSISVSVVAACVAAGFVGCSRALKSCNQGTARLAGIWVYIGAYARVCAIVLEYLFQRYVYSFTHLTHINRDNEKRGTEDECVVVCVCV